MSQLFGNPNAVAREIQGQFVQGRDTVVPPPKFGAVCRLLWPDKTAAHLASIAGNRDERTAKRWLAGEYDPPVVVLLAVMQKMFER